MNPQFQAHLDAALATVTDVARAPAMRAYMRDQFDYLGIGTPQRRLAAKPLIKTLKGSGADNLLDYACALWELPQAHNGMDAALAHENIWVRRTALLHQLDWRDKVDTNRLFNYALTLSHEKEFFIQKAIGWALRDYARHDPEAVRAFTLKEKPRLSALSFREANKHLSK
jgi:3-methyladenine DNA glycosylase AlkD